jgi:hypothetical protein
MLRKSAVIAVLALLLPLLAATGMSSSTAAPARSAAPALSLAQIQSMTTNISGMAYAAMPLWSPLNYTDPGGPTFNNPNGSKASQRRNLDRIAKMVRSTQGYRVRSVAQCPRVRAQFPNEIRIALYSFSDPRVADALIAAHRRCVSVQVLMNDHLSNGTVPAFGKLQRYLGTRMGSRSWARRCNNGCRGRGGVLHSKIYLFSQAYYARKPVVVGSSNMTGKAANVQWNDLIVFKDRPVMYGQYFRLFNEMAQDRLANQPAQDLYDGGYLTMVWPQYGMTRSRDRVMRELNRINCRARTTNGAGYRGRTTVTFNIHAWEGDRGMWIAGKIANLKNTGCDVRVLYGLMAPRIHRYLKSQGVRTRRTIFDRDGNGLTEMYTHMKQVTISGVYDGNRSMYVTYTGSENFSHKTVVSDEIWMAIPGGGIWSRYQRHFNMIWSSNYYSNWTYAWYSQSSTPVHARPKNAIIVDAEDLELG